MSRGQTVLPVCRRAAISGAATWLLPTMSCGGVGFSPKLSPSLWCSHWIQWQSRCWCKPLNVRGKLTNISNHTLHLCCMIVERHLWTHTKGVVDQESVFCFISIHILKEREEYSCSSFQNRQACIFWTTLNNYSNTLLSPANSAGSKSIASAGLKLFRNLAWIQLPFQPNINVVPFQKMKTLKMNTVVVPL